ncbi:MAG: alpha/beta fold hydrolase [Microbacterium sp.]
MIRPSEEYARDAAETTIGDGETVALLLHGLGGDRHQPLGLVGAEPVDGLTIVAPDQRGHGETDVIGAPDDFRVERLADDASALLAHRGLAERPLIVMGISMGAAVALRLLQRDEHDLRGGVLIRPAFETEPWPDHLRVFQDVAGALRTSGPGGLEGFLASPRYREVAARSEACAKSLREQFTKPRALERVVRLENVPANPSITWDGTWAPPCPVTVVGALRDPIHPWSTAQLWHERIAGADLVQAPSRDREPGKWDRVMRQTLDDRLRRSAR